MEIVSSADALDRPTDSHQRGAYAKRQPMDTYPSIAEKAVPVVEVLLDVTPWPSFAPPEGHVRRGSCVPGSMGRMSEVQTSDLLLHQYTVVAAKPVAAIRAKHPALNRGTPQGRPTNLTALSHFHVAERLEGGGRRRANRWPAVVNSKKVSLEEGEKRAPYTLVVGLTPAACGPERLTAGGSLMGPLGCAVSGSRGPSAVGRRDGVRVPLQSAWL